MKINKNNIDFFGYDYIGGANAAEEYDSRLEELKKRNLEAVYNGVKTYKIARYDGELENGKGKVYFFPYYLITSEKAIVPSKNVNSDFVNITGIIGLKDYTNTYRNIYLIKKKDMAEKGFRALLLDLITKNLILLNNKKEKTIDPETIPEGIKLNNLINFWNRNKDLIDYRGNMNLLLVNTLDGTYAVINVYDECYASTSPTETVKNIFTKAATFEKAANESTEDFDSCVTKEPEASGIGKYSFMYRHHASLEVVGFTKENIEFIADILYSKSDDIDRYNFSKFNNMFVQVLHVLVQDYNSTESDKLCLCDIQNLFRFVFNNCDKMYPWSLKFHIKHENGKIFIYHFADDEPILSIRVDPLVRNRTLFNLKRKLFNGISTKLTDSMTEMLKAQYPRLLNDRTHMFNSKHGDYGIDYTDLNMRTLQNIIGTLIMNNIDCSFDIWISSDHKILTNPVRECGPDIHEDEDDKEDVLVVKEGECLVDKNSDEVKRHKELLRDICKFKGKVASLNEANFNSCCEKLFSNKNTKRPNIPENIKTLKETFKDNETKDVKPESFDEDKLEELAKQFVKRHYKECYTVDTTNILRKIFYLIYGNYKGYSYSNAATNELQNLIAKLNTGMSMRAVIGILINDFNSALNNGEFDPEEEEDYYNNNWMQDIQMLFKFMLDNKHKLNSINMNIMFLTNMNICITYPMFFSDMKVDADADQDYITINKCIREGKFIEMQNPIKVLYYHIPNANICIGFNGNNVVTNRLIITKNNKDNPVRVAQLTKEWVTMLGSLKTLVGDEGGFDISDEDIDIIQNNWKLILDNLAEMYNECSNHDPMIHDLFEKFTMYILNNADEIMEKTKESITFKYHVDSNGDFVKDF